VNRFLEEAMGGVTKGGVGAGPRLGPPSGYGFPPRVSLFGVRSLSLVFADLGTLLFFVLLFILFSLSCFVFHCNQLTSGIITIHARAPKLDKGLKRRSAI
jgi:hypothetical protein